MRQLLDLLLERAEVQKEMHLSSGNTLIFIDLERTKVDAEAFQSLMESLIQHKSLTTLYISWQNPELINTVKEMVKRLKAHNVLHDVVLANAEWDGELTTLMSELLQQLKHNHINKTQKNLLETKLKPSLESIVDALKAEPYKVISALESIKVSVINKEIEEQLRSVYVLETIELLREVLVSPCPQNRVVGSRSAAYDLTEQLPSNGVVEGIVYFYGRDGEATSEEQGLLGLTVENTSLDNMRLTAPPITKAAVAKEVHHWIEAEISAQQEKLMRNVEVQQSVIKKRKI